MNFTREPIVETVITPKEGFKLIIRNSSGSNSEEYSVNAVEVVSFGNSYFFRNMEKPKAFLFPLSEYEVLETRETRTVLKKPQVEKSIKIGKKSKLSVKAETPPVEEREASEKEDPNKKERKRTRKRRGKEPVKNEEAVSTAAEKAEPSSEEEIASPSVRRTLLPPPTSLISEQISRYKDFLTSQGAIIPDEGAEEEESKIENLEPRSKKEDDMAFSFSEEVTSQEPFLGEEIPSEEQAEMFFKEGASIEKEKIVDLPSPTPDADETR